MDMNRTFFAKAESKNNSRWCVIDAEGQIVGRLATQIAKVLRGKDRAVFTPHADTGDYVIVINADKVVFSGDKMENKEYIWYTGWIGGQKRATAKELMRKDPAEILRHAIVGMLPKNTMSRSLERKLKIYAGSEHPHAAQEPEVKTFAQLEDTKS